MLFRSDRSTNACDAPTVVGSIRPNEDLTQYASDGLGDYSRNGTQDELKGIWNELERSPQMVGTLSMDITLDANNQIFTGGDNSESVTVTLVMQVFQTGTLTPVTG